MTKKIDWKYLSPIRDDDKYLSHYRMILRGKTLTVDYFSRSGHELFKRYYKDKRKVIELINEWHCPCIEARNIILPTPFLLSMKNCGNGKAQWLYILDEIYEVWEVEENDDGEEIEWSIFFFKSLDELKLSWFDEDFIEPAILMDKAKSRAESTQDSAPSPAATTIESDRNSED